MTSKSISNWLIALLLIASVAACGPAPASAPPATEATTVVDATPAPTEAAASPATSPTESADTSPAETAVTDSELPTGLVTYVIVPEESSASYLANEEFFGLALGKYGIPEGLVDTVGTTQVIEGQFQLNWDNLNSPLGESTFTVDLSTLESNQTLRDDWIRDNGPEFATYPTATFVGESLEGAPTSYTPGEEVNFQLIGQMTIREITQPATFNITAKLEDGTVTGTATAALLMSDFGITPPDFANTLTVDDAFEVKIDFTARAQ
jgi:polyisoprenoid-binding protein YceI